MKIQRVQRSSLAIIHTRALRGEPGDEAIVTSQFNMNFYGLAAITEYVIYDDPLSG